MDTKDITEEIIKKAQEGDVRAFENIVCIYKPLLIYLANKYAINSSDREEMYQEGLIELWEATQTYKPGYVKIKTYFWLCIEKAIFRFIRTKNRLKNQILNNAVRDQEWLLWRPSPSPEDIIVEKEKSADILIRLGNILTDLEYNVFLMYYIGYSYREIGAKMKLDKKQINNALTRVKQKYRKSNIKESSIKTPEWKVMKSNRHIALIDMNNLLQDVEIEPYIIEIYKDGKITNLQYVVLSLNLNGMSNLDIAKKLNTKPKSVMGTLKNCRKKIKNKPELVRATLCKHRKNIK